MSGRNYNGGIIFLPTGDFLPCEMSPGGGGEILPV